MDNSKPTSGPLKLVGDDLQFVDIPLTERTISRRVWHYTGVDGLLGIIQHRQIWASSTLSLNDQSEVTYGLGIFKSAWDAFPRSGLSTTQVSYMDALLSDRARLALSRDFFLVSASRSNDSLNQWQGYARAQGYAVEIDTTTGLAYLLNGETVDRDMGIMGGWFDVIYETDEQTEAARDVIRFILERHVPDFNGESGAIDRKGQSAVSLMASSSVLFKHPAFTAEQEVRYIFTKAPSLHELYRPGPRGIVPYVRLVTGPAGKIALYADDASELMPICGVVCGPMDAADRPIAENAVGRLLTTHGYHQTTVSHSQAPYRF